MKQTIRGKLVAIQDGIYINYVFQNLDVDETSEDRYVMITRCPNWQFPYEININDIGFVNYDFAKAGEEYLELSSNTTKTYKYTANYFMNFIPEKETKDNTKEFNF